MTTTIYRERINAKYFYALTKLTTEDASIDGLLFSYRVMLWCALSWKLNVCTGPDQQRLLCDLQPALP